MRCLRVLLIVALFVPLAPARAGGGSGALVLSKDGGLGRIEFHDDLGAVLQRDEGIVAILDMKDGAPEVIGRYGDGAQDSLDGDLAFSHDGRYLFYARQTVQFSRDGLHVIDLADPTQPALSTYHPMGGSYRVEYLKQGDAEWVFVLDAIHGLVVFRFEPTTGQVVPVAIDALPQLKVGGPASAGIFIDERDPKLKVPLMYVTTGKAGLQIYDISDPVTPEIIGTWDEVGLAEVEVATTKRKRTVYAATEYWFDKTLPPEIVVLDATNPGEIEESDRWAAGAKADTADAERIQGMALGAGGLYVAHSRLGLVTFDRSGKVTSRRELTAGTSPGPKAQGFGGPYAIDVEVRGGTAFFTDASFGVLSWAPLSSI